MPKNDTPSTAVGASPALTPHQVADVVRDIIEDIDDVGPRPDDIRSILIGRLACLMRDDATGTRPSGTPTMRASAAIFERAATYSRDIGDARGRDLSAAVEVLAETLVDRDRLVTERDEWKAAAQLRMTTGFAQGMRAQLQCQVRLDQAPGWLAGFDFAAEMFGEPRRLRGAVDS